MYAVIVGCGRVGTLLAQLLEADNHQVALVARDTFAVPTVVARIADPQREQIYRRLGIHTISSTTLGRSYHQILAAGHQ